MSAQAASGEIIEFPEISPYAPETAEEYIGCKLPKSKDGEPDWVWHLRQEGLEYLRAGGLPTPKLERWKYTHLARAVKDFDGVLCKASITHNGAESHVTPLMGALDRDWVKETLTAPAPGEDTYQDMMLWHLGDAYLRDGLVIDIPAGEIVETPLEITFTGEDDSFTAPRLVIRLGKGAQLQIVERHQGQGEYWNTMLTQIELADGARLTHTRLQKNAEDAIYTQNTHINMERDAHYDTFTLCLGAGVSRNQVHAVLGGPNGHCELNGINLLSGKQHGDSTFLIEHTAPHCESHQFIRSLLNDEARGVFQGKVHVHQEAQKTDGYQLSNALLLSPDAQMDTKPELEIYADDVKCSHGATTGQLDEEPLFYLRQRGLNEAQARFLLIQSFVDEAVGKVGDEKIRGEILEETETWLHTALKI